MASAFSHALVAVAFGKGYKRNLITWPVVLLGIVCSIVPDVDVIGFHYGISYGDLLGHRGLTHSLFFAGLLSGVLAAMWPWQTSGAAKAGIFFYLFLCTTSHGVLDALTDGGLGVAFFAPLDTTRYFFPLRPVAVSPIGIDEFFGEHALRILVSEAMWIWLPTVAASLILRGLQRVWLDRPVAARSRID